MLQDVEQHEGWCTGQTGFRYIGSHAATHSEGHVSAKSRNFWNNGSEYTPVNQPVEVLDHDFPLSELGKAIPVRCL